MHCGKLMSAGDRGTNVFAHVHIMKTGGQTLCDIFRRSFGARHCDLRCGNVATLEDLRFAQRFYPKLESIGGHSVRAWSELAALPELRLFTILREPITRCLSHYQFDRVRNRKSVDFLTWLDERRNYMTRFLAGSEDADAAIAILEERIEFVGLLEDFDRTLHMLQAWCGKPLSLDYKSRNIASRNSIKNEILDDPELVEAMHESHALDKIVYEHVQSTLYPRIVDRYEHHTSSEAPTRQFARRLPWSAFKRACLYKPAAKLRQQLRRAA